MLIFKIPVQLVLWLSVYFCLDCFEFAFVCLSFPLRTDASAASRRFHGWHWLCFSVFLNCLLATQEHTQFLVFPFTLWFVVLFHSGLRKYIIWFQFWEQYWDFVCYLTWHLPWDCLMYIQEKCARRYCLMNKSVASWLRAWLSPDISLWFSVRIICPLGKVQ